jgi:hypothetical protein
MTRDCYADFSIRRALQTFKRYGPMSPSAWSVLASRHETHGACGFLLRLHRLGLLNRNRDATDLIVYSISARGIERLSMPQNQDDIPQGSRTGSK